MRTIYTVNNPQYIKYYIRTITYKNTARHFSNHNIAINNNITERGRGGETSDECVKKEVVELGLHIILSRRSTLQWYGHVKRKDSDD